MSRQGSYWPDADLLQRLFLRQLFGAKRTHVLIAMYGPAVRCKRFFVELSVAVLHQCIRPLIGACAPGQHGYQRARVLINGPASTGPCGSPVFACAGKTDPPSLLIPLADLGGQTNGPIEELAWTGAIGVPTDGTTQEIITKRLKSGPFAVVFPGAVATSRRLIKISPIAHGL
jgi:hypothetical protein